VAVGVGQVDGLADEVVRRTDERQLLLGGVREPPREVDALGDAQGEVVQAGVAATEGLNARPLDQLQDDAATDGRVCGYRSNDRSGLPGCKW